MVVLWVCIAFIAAGCCSCSHRPCMFMAAAGRLIRALSSSSCASSASASSSSSSSAAATSSSSHTRTVFVKETFQQSCHFCTELWNCKQGSAPLTKIYHTPRTGPEVTPSFIPQFFSQIVKQFISYLLHTQNFHMTLTNYDTTTNCLNLKPLSLLIHLNPTHIISRHIPALPAPSCSTTCACINPASIPTRTELREFYSHESSRGRDGQPKCNGEGRRG